jgi:serine O-acetyltransferase
MNLKKYLSLVKGDLKTYKPKGSYFRIVFWFFTDYRLHILLLLRTGCFLRGKFVVSLFCPFIKYLILVLYSSDLSFQADYGSELRFGHPVGIVIGQRAKIGNKCTIFQRVTLGAVGGGKKTEYPTIGDNVTIYPNSTIVGNINVGKGAIIAAHSFVNESVVPGCVVGGVPAKIIKKY